MAENGKTLDPKTFEKIVFVCHAQAAQNVFLTGSFNGWDPQTTPMQIQEEDMWRAELELAPGQYEYKFVVDGAWCCEPGREDSAPCPGCVPNSFGTMNRVVEIREGSAVVEVGASAAA